VVDYQGPRRDGTDHDNATNTNTETITNGRLAKRRAMINLLSGAGCVETRRRRPRRTLGGEL